MAELTPEARSVYNLVQGEMEDLFDWKLSFANTLTKSFTTKIDATTMDFIVQIQELRDEISFDVDVPSPSLHAVAKSPVPAPIPPMNPSPVVTRKGVAGMSSPNCPVGSGAAPITWGKDTYIPPPARGWIEPTFVAGSL